MRITSELIEDLRENYGKFPPKYFAEKYDLSVRTIHSLACWNKFTHRFHTKPKTKENREDIIKDYKNGLSIKKIIKKYKSSFYTVKKILIENGLKIRKDTNRKFKINEDYFAKIDTPKKAYWLGFIYGDGNIWESKFQLHLQHRDKYILQDLLDDMDSEHKLYQNHGHPKIYISSPKLVNHLKKFGLIPNKSLTLKAPKRSYFNKVLDRYFLLGFFDADGSINKKSDRVDIIGTESMVKWAKDRLGNFGKWKIRKEKRSNHGLTFVFCLYLNLSNREKIYNYLYEGHNFGLKRKKERFESRL